MHGSFSRYESRDRNRGSSQYSSCVLVRVFSSVSHDKLNMTQLGGHVFSGSLRFEHVEEINFTFYDCDILVLLKVTSTTCCSTSPPENKQIVPVLVQLDLLWNLMVPFQADCSIEGLFFLDVASLQELGVGASRFVQVLTVRCVFFVAV